MGANSILGIFLLQEAVEQFPQFPFTKSGRTIRTFSFYRLDIAPISTFYFPRKLEFAPISKFSKEEVRSLWMRKFIDLNDYCVQMDWDIDRSHCVENIRSDIPVFDFIDDSNGFLL